MAKAPASYPRRSSSSRPSSRQVPGPSSRADSPFGEFVSPFSASNAASSLRTSAQAGSRSSGRPSARTSGGANVPYSTGAYAYPTSGSAARQPYIREDVIEQPRFEAVGGGRARAEERSIAVPAVAIAAAVAVIVLVAAICFVRIKLIDSAVILGSESQELSYQVDEMRSDASALEVQDTILSEKSHIQAAATELKMAEPATAEAIYLSEDVVATNEDGSLCLAESVRRASRVAAAE